MATGALTWAEDGRQQAGHARKPTPDRTEEKDLEWRDLYPREKEEKRPKQFPEKQTQKANRHKKRFSFTSYQRNAN